MRRIILLFLFVSTLIGCASAGHLSGDLAGSAKNPISSDHQRKVIKSASITIESREPETTFNNVQSIVEKMNGVLLSSDSYIEDSINVSVKVPQKDLGIFVSKISELGKVRSKSLTSKDVTNEMIDISARLKNLYKLRERFRGLLAKAISVGEVLEVEKELNRIQTDIDSLEGQINTLKDQVSYSKVSIHLRKSTVYGPLGYLFKGIYWAVSKLFILE